MSDLRGADRALNASVVGISLGLFAAAAAVWAAVGWVLANPWVLWFLLIVPVVAAVEAAAAVSAVLDWREGRLAQTSWRHGLWLGHATAISRARRRARWYYDGVRNAWRQDKAAIERAGRHGVRRDIHEATLRDLTADTPDQEDDAA